MKTASNELIYALQNYADLKFAELYTIILLNGNSYRYTSLDVNIGPFISGDVLIDRGAIKQARGVEPSELSLALTPVGNANISGVGWLAAIRNGVLDGATIRLDRTFYRWWDQDQLIGTITLFKGFVSEIDPIGRISASLYVKSLTELLSVQWPRMTYQSQCVWRLYDIGCTANRTTFTVSGNISANGNTTFFSTDLGQANNYFDLGVIRFTSGNNLDVARTIKTFYAGNIAIAFPLQYAPVANDTFQIYPGCDRQQSTCANKFNNANNFRGFPFIPAPESIV